MRPPLLLGVRRPLGLRIAGRSADGAILAEPSPPAYVRWARERLEEGRAAAGRTEAPRITVFVAGRVDADRTQARALVAGMLANDSVAAQLAPLERDDELARLRALDDPAAIPDDLVDLLTAAGTPGQVAASLRALAAAGADSVAFAPFGPDPGRQLHLLATEVAPLLTG